MKEGWVREMTKAENSNATSRRWASSMRGREELGVSSLARGIMLCSRAIVSNLTCKSGTK